MPDDIFLPRGVIEGVENIHDGNTATKEEISKVLKF